MTQEQAESVAPVILSALAIFPDTEEADWRLVGAATVHKSVEVGPRVQFCGPAILRGGMFYGGMFRGGVFHSGEFRGGMFHSGEFYSGMFYGGVFRGGVFHSGMFYGGVFRSGDFYGGAFYGGMFCSGVFHSGVFYGGLFYGGEFYGGMFRGGEFHSGVFRESSLFIAGILPWTVNVAGPNLLAIGCECHTFDEWRSQLPAIAKKHRVNEATLAQVRQLIDYADEWLRENPVPPSERPEER